MQTVTLEEAKDKLGELIEQAAKGEPFLIEAEGKLRFQVTAEVLPFALSTPRTLGWLDGKFTVPDDIKTPYKDEIEAMFYGDE